VKNSPIGRIVMVVALVSSLAPICAAQTLVDELGWAYAISPAVEAPADDGTRYTLPGAAASFTLDQIRNRMGPADWFPGDHPPMPPIVANGREQAGIYACALCHYPNGKGRPENAGVAGLPKDYIVQQLRDYADGARRSAEPRKANTELMIAFARGMTDAEIEASAEYFAAMAWTAWIDVVEADRVPKTRIAGGMHLALEGTDAGTEPLGRRIVEMPKDTISTEVKRDPRSGFIAYVPTGAIARGKQLAESREGRTTRCAICHGEDLAGLAFVPALRGRSPSYIARQLVDFKTGARRGAWAPLMAQAVAELSGDDILALSAYLASLPPAP
jgi:cytochrome c553